MGKQGEERQGEEGADQDSHVMHGMMGGVFFLTAASSIFPHGASALTRRLPAGGETRQGTTQPERARGHQQT